MPRPSYLLHAAALIVTAACITAAPASSAEEVDLELVDKGCFTSCQRSDDCAGVTDKTCGTCFMGQCVKEAFAEEASAAFDANRAGRSTAAQKQLIESLPDRMRRQAEAAAKRLLRSLNGRRGRPLSDL